VFVPPGVLHAIGEGTFLAEVQEPEDLSILLEWDGFELDGERDGHLGLGFAVALDAVETTARTSEDARRLIRYATEDGPALATAADPFFRLDRVSHDLTLEPSLAIVIGLEGSMILGTDGGTLTDVSAGTTTIVPAGAGTMRFTGAGTVLVARPPLPR
jgi:mannose-6-phosphate isomerase